MSPIRSLSGARSSVPSVTTRCMSCQPASEMKSAGDGSLHFSSERLPLRKKSSALVSSVPSPSWMRSVICSENMSLCVSKMPRHV